MAILSRSGKRPDIDQQSRQKFRAASKQAMASGLPVDWPPFVSYAWKDYSPQILIELLLSSNRSYAPHKGILFSSLCAWTVCPDRGDLRRHAAVIQAINYLRRAEAVGSKAGLKGTKVDDLIIRMSLIGADFYSDFYYPVGGIDILLRCMSPKTLKNSLAKKSKDIDTVVLLMSIFDFHAKNLGNEGRFSNASLKKGTELVQTVFRSQRQAKPGAVNKDNADDRWKRLFVTAALSYAASTIAVGEAGSLLDVIRRGDADYAKHKGLIPQWMARARFAADGVLARLESPRYGEASQSYLPMVEPEPTPEPSFTPAEQAGITTAFSREAQLAGRLRAERTRSKQGV